MKIINGLFSPAYGYFRAIAGIILGVLLIIWPDVASKTVVQVIGCFMVIIGGVSFALSFRDKESYGGIMSINGVFDILFGVVLMLFPNFFAELLMYVLGFMMLVFGIGQIASLVSARRLVKVGILLFIIPVLISACGIVMLFRPFESMSTLFMIFGIALVFYGFSEFISTIKLRRVIKMQKEYEYRIEDSDFEEVESNTTSSDEGEDNLSR